MRYLDRFALWSSDKLFRLAMRYLADDPHTASRYFLASLACAPDSAAGWLNLGNCLMARGDAHGALGCSRRAMALDPAAQQPKINTGIALITLGQWEEGWNLFKARFHSETFRSLNGLKGGDERKSWNGQSLDGKTLLVFHEQGMGDTLMCLRYIEQLPFALKRVIVLVPAPLNRLVRASLGSGDVPVTVISNGDRIPHHDYLIPFMSLPAFAHARADAGAPSSYLKLYDTEPAYTFTPPLEGLRVGIVWAGSPGHQNDSRRSIPLDTLAPLFDTPGVSWVSLQVGARAKEIERFPHVRQVKGIGDFYDTAAVMKSLDLVISVDSSPAHLAGALGVPVWTLITYAADFRWMQGRTDTPWYRTMTLVRQPTAGDWASVIEHVRSRLVLLTQIRSAA